MGQEEKSNTRSYVCVHCIALVSHIYEIGAAVPLKGASTETVVVDSGRLLFVLAFGDWALSG